MLRPLRLTLRRVLRRTGPEPRRGRRHEIRAPSGVALGSEGHGTVFAPMIALETGSDDEVFDIGADAEAASCDSIESDESEEDQLDNALDKNK